MGGKLSKKPVLTSLAKAKLRHQAASGVAFVGFAAAAELIGGIQYILFAPTTKDLAAVFEATGGPLLDIARVKPVSIFERNDTPNAGNRPVRRVG